MLQVSEARSWLDVLVVFLSNGIFAVIVLALVALAVYGVAIKSRDLLRGRDSDSGDD